jgi:hypothetical protein
MIEKKVRQDVEREVDVARCEIVEVAGDPSRYVEVGRTRFNYLEVG